jgi:hypothetical protein
MERPGFSLNWAAAVEPKATIAIRRFRQPFHRKPSSIPARNVDLWLSARR